MIGEVLVVTDVRAPPRRSPTSTPTSCAPILDLAERADRPRSAVRSTGSGAALIFEKPSNRTRQSMEMAVVQLGGHPVYTRGDEVGFDTREPVEDVARIMAGYHAVLAARVFDHDDRSSGWRRSSTCRSSTCCRDHVHPLQALADVLTMQQVLGPLAGTTVAWVGDYNNVARSLAEARVLLGVHVRLGCPVGYGADDAELERLGCSARRGVDQTHRPAEAVAGADAVHTDTWVSMGQEAEKDGAQAGVRGLHRRRRR